MEYHYCQNTAACFFGWRNGLSIDPMEGVNYTQETLRYMTPPKRADEVTDLILENFQLDGLTIYESNGGIGGNTMSFLDNSRIKRVVTYEIVPERYQMLVNNLKAYQFNPERYQVNLGGFIPPSTGVEEGLVYMDPPWLSETENPLASKNYLTQGIKFGDKTLEQWLVECQTSLAVVMRVPPGYRLAVVPGYEYKTIKIKKSLVYICRSTAALNSLYQRILAANPPPILRPITPELGLILNTTEAKYIETLKFLQWDLYQRLLKPIIPDPIVRLAYVTKEQMEHWIRAFTHKLFDVVNNYERVEFLGDSVAKQILVEQIDLRYPDLSEGEFTNAKHYVEGEKRFIPIARELNLMKYAFLPIPHEQAHPKIYEDLFEAYVGTLYQVAKNVQGVEAYAITSRIIEYPVINDLLNNVNTQLNAITRMKNYIEEFDMGYYANEKFYAKQKGRKDEPHTSAPEYSSYVRINTTQDPVSKHYRMEFILLPKGITQLRQWAERVKLKNPVSIPSPISGDRREGGDRGIILGRAEGQEKPTMQLMENSLRTLNQYGVNDIMYNAVKDLKQKAKINTEENLWDALTVALKSIYGKGVANFEVVTSDKLISTESVYAQLYAVFTPSLAGGKEEYQLLEAKTLPRGTKNIDIENKKDLIRSYLRRVGMQQLPALLAKLKNFVIISNPASKGTGPLLTTGENQDTIKIIQQPTSDPKSRRVVHEIKGVTDIKEARERLIRETLAMI